MTLVVAVVFDEQFNSITSNIVGGLDRCSFRTRYHTQVPEISGKLNGKKSAFTWATSLRSLGAEQLEPPPITSNIAFELYLSSLVEDPLFRGTSDLGRNTHTI
jgi:hypothetical protein